MQPAILQLTISHILYMRFSTVDNLATVRRVLGVVNHLPDLQNLRSGVSDFERDERIQLTVGYVTTKTATRPAKPNTLRHRMGGCVDCFRSLI